MPDTYEQSRSHELGPHLTPQDVVLAIASVWLGLAQTSPYPYVLGLGYSDSISGQLASRDVNDPPDEVKIIPATADSMIVPVFINRAGKQDHYALVIAEQSQPDKASFRLHVFHNRLALADNANGNAPTVQVMLGVGANELSQDQILRSAKAIIASRRSSRQNFRFEETTEPDVWDWVVPRRPYVQAEARRGRSPSENATESTGLLVILNVWAYMLDILLRDMESFNTTILESQSHNFYEQARGLINSAMAGKMSY